MTKRVLLTGASGFTGRYLEPLLHSKGYSVIHLDSAGQHACDLTDPRSTETAVRMARPDIVIHLAAVSFVAHGHPEDFYRVNVIGTLNLLEALAKLDAAPSRVILASSANVYGSRAVEVLDESLCPAPVNHYGNSKLAMENMARTWFDRLPIVITRPFNYTGPGQANHFLIPKIVEHFRNRAPEIELGNLQVARDFSDVEDVALAYVALMDSDVRSEVVNICSGRAIALMDVLAEMKTMAGYEIRVRVNPELVRESEIPKMVGSRTKLTRLVTLPDPRPFRETLRRMYEPPHSSPV